MAARNVKGRTQQREVPQAVVIAAVVLIVIVLAAGGFYAYNGGWKTTAQQEAQYKHEFQPIMAAKHGDTEALDAENKLRKEQGQSPLVMPKGKQSGQPVNNMQKLKELQQKLGGGSGQ